MRRPTWKGCECSVYHGTKQAMPSGQRPIYPAFLVPHFTVPILCLAPTSAFLEMNLSSSTAEDIFADKEHYTLALTVPFIQVVISTNIHLHCVSWAFQCRHFHFLKYPPIFNLYFLRIPKVETSHHSLLDFVA